MEVFKTVLSGVAIFLLGQILLKLVLEPVQKLKQTFSAVSHAYLVHAPILYNPDAASDEQKNEAAGHLRLLSGQLHADLSLVPCYDLFRWLFFLPSSKKVYEAAQSLIAIGNWMYSSNGSRLDHIIKNWQRAADNLGLYIAPGERVSDDMLNDSIKNSLRGRGGG
jgi:hypothetical protein